MLLSSTYRLPIVISHQIWGRDPPSLCLISNDTVTINVFMEEQDEYALSINLDIEINARQKERLRKLLIDLLRDISPIPIKASISLRTSTRPSGLSLLSTSVHALLESLQAFYKEKIEPADYVDVLAGALIKAGLTLNQSRSIANCMLNNKSVIYSESYGVLFLESLSINKWLVSGEVEFPIAWSEPGLSEQYLDLLAKLSSLVISDIASYLSGDASKSYLLRLFNGIWYIMGFHPWSNGDHTEDERYIISISIPGWLVKYRFD